MTKIKLQIKNRFTGSLIFEFEKENNTIKDTVLEAIKSSADLRSANLSCANLSYADLRSADLRSANLSCANLSYANLSCANLRSANLRCADLSYADLRSANLSYADLRSADLSYADLRSANLRYADLSSADLYGKKIKSIIVFTGLYEYIVIPYITKEGDKWIKMGCYNRSLKEWQDDFWNNNSEFPNNNSVKSNLRLMAFETAKAWFNIVEPKTDNDE